MVLRPLLPKSTGPRSVGMNRSIPRYLRSSFPARWGFYGRAPRAGHAGTGVREQDICLSTKWALRRAKRRQRDVRFDSKGGRALLDTGLVPGPGDFKKRLYRLDHAGGQYSAQKWVAYRPLSDLATGFPLSPFSRAEAGPPAPPDVASFDGSALINHANKELRPP